MLLEIMIRSQKSMWKNWQIIQAIYAGNISKNKQRLTARKCFHKLLEKAKYSLSACHLVAQLHQQLIGPVPCLNVTNTVLSTLLHASHCARLQGKSYCRLGLSKPSDSIFFSQSLHLVNCQIPSIFLFLNSLLSVSFPVQGLSKCVQAFVALNLNNFNSNLCS